jgi:hypothetical protein
VPIAVPEEVCKNDASREAEGCEEEIKPKLREVLERKRAQPADANAARVTRTPGRRTAPAARPRVAVRFAARQTDERLTERIMQRPDDHG